MLCALVRPGERKRSLALLCTASITARARERLSALYGEEEEDHHRGRRRRACAAHNTPTSEGREGHDTNSSWGGRGRERERERGIYKPRAVAAWAMLLGCRRNGGEDDDAQML